MKKRPAILVLETILLSAVIVLFSNGCVAPLVGMAAGGASLGMGAALNNTKGNAKVTFQDPDVNDLNAVPRISSIAIYPGDSCATPLTEALSGKQFAVLSPNQVQQAVKETPGLSNLTGEEQKSLASKICETVKADALLIVTRKEGNLRQPMIPGLMSTKRMTPFEVRIYDQRSKAWVFHQKGEVVQAAGAKENATEEELSQILGSAIGERLTTTVLAKN